jgi:hypothetical protein
MFEKGGRVRSRIRLNYQQNWIPMLGTSEKRFFYAELEASDSLLKEVSDERDKKTIESEIAELKMALYLSV